jgi:hypothetical protein
MWGPHGGNYIWRALSSAELDAWLPLRPWTWRRCLHPKRRILSTLHSVTMQKTALFAILFFGDRLNDPLFGGLQYSYSWGTGLCKHWIRTQSVLPFRRSRGAHTCIHTYITNMSVSRGAENVYILQNLGIDCFIDRYTSFCTLHIPESTDKTFWEELIAYFPLIRHAPHRRRCVQQFFYCCVYSLQWKRVYRATA